MSRTFLDVSREAPIRAFWALTRWYTLLLVAAFAITVAVCQGVILGDPTGMAILGITGLSVLWAFCLGLSFWETES